MTRISARDGTGLFIDDRRPSTEQTGATILCLSGITRNGKDFHRLADDLTANGHRMVMLDYRGRGRSDRAADPMSYNPITYLDDIRNVLTALDLHRVVVIGTSLGGFLAMGMALAVPSALAGVILNDCGPEIPRDGIGRIIAYVSDPTAYDTWDEAIDAVKTMLPDLNLDDAGWRLAAEGCYTEQPDGRIHPDWDTRMGEALRASGEPPDFWPMFRALRSIPTLAIRGELSNFLSLDCFEKMMVEHPRMRTLTIANRGHTPTLDEPDSRSAIHEFLATLS